MSILTGTTNTVYIIAGPPKYISSDERVVWWCGGDRWSHNIDDAVLFQTHESAKLQVDAMNMRDWRIAEHSVSPATRAALDEAFIQGLENAADIAKGERIEGTLRSKVEHLRGRES